MNLDDFFGKLDDVIYKPVEVICDYIREPLESVHARRDRNHAEHEAELIMKMKEFEDKLENEKSNQDAERQQQLAREAAELQREIDDANAAREQRIMREAKELEVEMRKANEEINMMIDQQEDDRRDRLVESLKRYQLELATASQDIVNNIAVMSLELRKEANEMIVDYTMKYKKLQTQAIDEADQRLVVIQQRYANNERVRIKMEDSIINQMDSVIEKASSFISELADDIKRMNANIDDYMRIQLEFVNKCILPMKETLGMSQIDNDNIGQIGYSEKNSRCRSRMGILTINRNQRICALCKYWNDAIGSTTIQIVTGGMMFKLDNNEKQSCFKPGRGMVISALQTCPYFRPRYDD